MLQSGWSILSRDFTSEPRSDRTMNIANRKRRRHRFTFLERRPAEVKQRFAVERVLDRIGLRRLTIAAESCRNSRLKKYLREIQIACFPVIDVRHLQALRM